MVINLAFGRAVVEIVYDLVVVMTACVCNVIERVPVRARAVVKLGVTVRVLEVLPGRVKGLGRVQFIRVTVGECTMQDTLGAIMSRLTAIEENTASGSRIPSTLRGSTPPLDKNNCSTTRTLADAIGMLVSSKRIVIHGISDVQVRAAASNADLTIENLVSFLSTYVKPARRSDNNRNPDNEPSKSSDNNDICTAVIQGIPVDVLIDSGALNVSLISSAVVNYFSGSRKPTNCSLKGIGDRGFVARDVCLTKNVRRCASTVGQVLPKCRRAHEVTEGRALRVWLRQERTLVVLQALSRFRHRPGRRSPDCDDDNFADASGPSGTAPAGPSLHPMGEDRERGVSSPPEDVPGAAEDGARRCPGSGTVLAGVVLVHVLPWFGRCPGSGTDLAGIVLVHVFNVGTCKFKIAMMTTLPTLADPRVPLLRVLLYILWAKTGNEVSPVPQKTSPVQPRTVHGQERPYKLVLVWVVSIPTTCYKSERSVASGFICCLFVE
uniref:Uncharacterized protein n=1 Tax=Heliothis virescens TaxID=7102 RepID=A0A2A4JPG9_HELVI